MIFLNLIIMIPILIGSWAYSPQKYVVSEKSIKIVRQINSIFLMYAKNDKFVMIYADKKYVLSPDEKERFIIEVKNKLEKPGKRRV